MPMNFRKARPEEPEINLIPFIDVLLVVLIFLMLSTTYSKFTELQTLSQKIEPLQMKVIDLPEIKKLRDDFANAVDAEVKRLDPQSEKLTARFEELSGKLTAMQKEFMELQRKSMPPAPSSALPPVPSPSPQPK